MSLVALTRPLPDRSGACGPSRGSASLPVDSRGAGLLGSTFGLLFFLVFMLLAVQVLWSLYATSVVTAAAYDAGRLAARTNDSGAAVARFDRTIGTYDASVSITVGDEVTVVVVRGENPTVLPDRWAAALPFASIDRTLRIRSERHVR